MIEGSEDEDDEPTLEELNTRIRKTVVPSNRKKRLTVSASVRDIEDTIEIDGDESYLEEYNLCTQTFNPLYMFSLWKESVTLVKIVTIYIVLPSKVCAGDSQFVL